MVYRVRPRCQHGQDTLHANSPERNTVGTNGGHIQRTHLDIGAKQALSSLIIDDVLSWTGHMNALSRKVAQKTGALWLCRHSLDLSSGRLYYITVTQSDLLYRTLAFYHGLSAHEKDRFTRLRKSAVRAICRVPPSTPSAPLFTRLNLHTPHACIQVKQLSICYLSLHGSASPLFQSVLLPRTKPTV